LTLLRPLEASTARPDPMKKLILALSFCSLPLLIAAVPTNAQQKTDSQPVSSKLQGSKEQKVRQLLELTGSAKMGEQVIARLIMQFERMPQLPDGYIAKFKELAKPQDLVDLIVPIYSRSLDEKDLDAVIKFFQSGVGKRWMTSQLKIQKDSMAANQTWTRNLHKSVLKAIQK
jgi:uncharacterized protein